MPGGSRGLAVARLLERRHDVAHRYIDCQLRVVYRDDRSRCATLMTVGGRWDRQERVYDGPTERERIIEIHPGQRDAAEWWCEWLRRYLADDWDGYERAWSALLHGGRRAGKSHLALVALVMYAIAVPESIVWAVAPTDPKTAELRRALGSPGRAALMPRAWYRWLKEDRVFRLCNGSEILLQSGKTDLKEGRVDLALYNEGQLMRADGYAQIRGGIADRGGMVLIAANPPDRPIGRWIAEYHDRVKAGKQAGRLFWFDPFRNPHINHDALRTLESELDEDSYAREVLGQFRPIGDVVLHAFSREQNVRPVPTRYIDVTATWCGRLGLPASEWILGADFDKYPELAGVVCKLYEDPDRPGEVMLWVLHEAIAHKSDEDGLIDELEALTDARGRPLLDKRRCVVVADASGRFQGTKRLPDRYSWDYFKARKWRVRAPDRRSKKNPVIMERVKRANAMFCARSGTRRVFVHPRCRDVIRALCEWPNRNGIPYRRSPWAHKCDAVTYVVWRVFGAAPRARSAPRIELREQPPRVEQLRRL
jgi:hypothetical protein